VEKTFVDKHCSLCAQYRPDPRWAKIGNFREAPRLLGRVLPSLHLASFIHPRS
jgi:hypothetical protein